MSKIRRVMSVLVGLLGLLLATEMLHNFERGYQQVLVVMSVSLILYGIRCLRYYAVYDRYMICGKLNFYIGIITFDFGMFSLALTDVSGLYVMIYLLLCNFFTGGIDILRALEAKKLEGPHWKLKLTEGIATLVLAVIGLFNLSSARMVVELYCLGLIISSVAKIVAAFRKTAIVYIQ